MSFSQPLFLLFGLLAVPIVLLYMLRLRHRPVEVSSILLWRRTVEDRQANTPWQRLRRNLFLILQLLALAALTLALSDPVLHTDNIVLAERTVVLLDASASMNAVDVSPSRFGRGKRLVEGLIDEMPTDGRMSILLAGKQPQLLAASTDNRDELRSALATAEAGNGQVDWQGAMALAAGLLSQGSGEAKLVIVSDSRLELEGAVPLETEAQVLSIGKRSENLSLEALSVRPSEAGTELYARVANYGEESHSPLFSIYRGPGLAHSETLEIPPGEAVEVVLSGLPAEDAVYSAHLRDPADPNRSPDVLTLDNAAYAVHQSTAERRVLLFPSTLSPPEHNIFVEKALLSLPGLHPYRALPTEDGELLLPEGEFDAYILDGELPEELPAGHLLLIDPPDNPLFAVGGRTEVGADVEVVENPVTRYLDWRGIHVPFGKSAVLPDWAEVLVGSEQAPLIFAGTQGGRRIVVFNFDLYQSDLPLQVAFPLLMANVMDYLVPASPFQSGSNVAPGEPIGITGDFGSDELRVTDPTGTEHRLAPGVDGYLFTETDTLGVYVVEYEGSSGKKTTAFTVNLFDPQESNLVPGVDVHLTARGSASTSVAQTGRRLWPWLAAAGLAVLFIEWWAYQRGRRGF